MRKLRRALPWGLVVIFLVLFAVSWWIENCFIYGIDWSRNGTVIAASRLSYDLKLNLAAGFIAHLLWLGGYYIALGVGFTVDSIVQTYNAIPAHIRATRPMQAIAWTCASIAASVGGAQPVQIARGMEWTIGRLVMVLIAANGACWLYNLSRRGVHYLEVAIMTPVRFYSERELEENDTSSTIFLSDQNPDQSPVSTHQRRREYIQFFNEHVERIGIILPGGGAKGAYQAGALKAIYEFLDDYRSLHKVRMIAGSSTGAWNSMFWLAGMMGDQQNGGHSIERWWKHLTFPEIAEMPWLWAPFVTNHFLHPAPWRETFAHFFRKRCNHLFEEEAGVHFYFTRCDPRTGAIHYSTNWAGIADRIDALGLDQDNGYRFYDVIPPGSDAPKLIADAIFASMSIPPMFPHGRIGDRAFEDGSAAEAVPFRFAAPLENCDLIFVLPVNGAPARRGISMTGRLLRTMEMRQTALERATLRHSDLVNRMTERMERIDFGINTLEPALKADGVALDALTGLREELSEFSNECKRLYVFTACPSGELEIGPFQFWNRRGAADAFDLMYVQTRRELQSRFFEDIEPEDAHVVMVNGVIPAGAGLPKPSYRRPAQL